MRLLTRSDFYHRILKPSPAHYNHIILDACHAGGLLRRIGTKAPGTLCVGAVSEGEYVLFAFEYGPTAAGELDALAEAVLRDDALIIGVFQAVAIIPGTSRSGITMTAGLFLGLTREAASRFSFLLSIPTITLSGGLVTLDLLRSAQPVDWSVLGVGVLLSFMTAWRSWMIRPRWRSMPTRPAPRR
mgnify:CR=1 FL=1